MLRTGTSEEGTERWRGGRKRPKEEGARKGGGNGPREGSKGGSKGDRRREGAMEGGKLQGRYHEEDTGQYTVYSALNNPQRGHCP